MEILWWNQGKAYINIFWFLFHHSIFYVLIFQSRYLILNLWQYLTLRFFLFLQDTWYSVFLDNPSKKPASHLRMLEERNQIHPKILEGNFLTGFVTIFDWVLCKTDEICLILKIVKILRYHFIAHFITSFAKRYFRHLRFQSFLVTYIHVYTKWCVVQC